MNIVSPIVSVTNRLRATPGFQGRSILGFFLLAIIGILGLWLRPAASSEPPPAFSFNPLTEIRPMTELYSFSAPPHAGDNAQSELDKKLLSLRLKKAMAEVERRQKKLDRARLNYLKIRHQSAQSGLAERRAAAAREHIEQAAEALQQAKIDLEQARNAFRFAIRPEQTARADTARP